MRRPNATIHVYLHLDPVDMCKSIDGLSALIETGMGFSTLCPYCQKINITSAAIGLQSGATFSLLLEGTSQ